MQSSLDTGTGSDVGTAGAEPDDDVSAVEANEAVPASAAAVPAPGGQAPPAAAACRPLASQTEFPSVTDYQKIPNSGCDASVIRVDHTCQLLRGVALALPQRHKCQPLSLTLQ